MKSLAKHTPQLKKEAAEAFPKEAVWLITLGGCRQVANVDEDPLNHFTVTEQDMLTAYREGLIAVVHSHPNKPACPSLADMEGQVDTAVPWGIVCTNGTDSADPFWWGEGCEEIPLIGRGFRHGVTDCYSLIKDYYRQEKGVGLPEFPRGWGWWEDGLDLYTEGFPKAGFILLDTDVDEPREGDMWFSQIRAPVPNHGGIYLGDELILHHVTAKQPVAPQHMSRREPIHRWFPHITHWLRHKDLM